MSTSPAASSRPRYDWAPRHLAALLVANLGLSLGPLLVRLADTGPVAAGFWRLILAFPVIVLLSLREPRARRHGSGVALLLVLGGGIAFGLDLAAWHVGITRTKLGNASLFGNAGSLILMVWGLLAARRVPRVPELAAIATSLAGAALLMGGSLEISQSNLVGDLFCLTAGGLYAVYILLLASVRERIGNYSLLLQSMLTSIPLVLAIAWLRGEAIMPHDWTPLLVLAVTSQLIGQGGLVYSLRHFPPLVIGLVLLTQPAIAALAGWLVFHETLSGADILGMVLLAAALVLARAGDKR